MAMATAPLFASVPATASTAIKSLSYSFPRSRIAAANPNNPLSSPPQSLRATTRTSVSAAATTTFDVDQAPLSTKPSKSLPFRVGHGFDLHRLEPGYPLIIGGINIPHERGCEAHSDGDVLLHCVVDAILGALGLPDIGQIFPDSDPKWKGAPSSVFIKEAVRLMHEAGYELGNLDATLILQRPKLSPHKEAMRANLSELLGADPTVVNLKAKTHEKVDSLGENRSIAAHTVIKRPFFKVMAGIKPMLKQHFLVAIKATMPLAAKYVRRQTIYSAVGKVLHSIVR
ncbi:hypothetical protein FNV43_RR09330 [Rhamnella rubrinervis]|uniref:2-C-methyl-D-erythritol 2,4-cyclodiphosphate synthase n=1 Tax=Rhamnella rubrinervis TaxID=2594499 RepID=A0A8K0H9W9_9ROSA|nr:hypothetical protein FNV43_RR09330 [Rhamnella rubrinervis]